MAQTDVGLHQLGVLVRLAGGTVDGGLAIAGTAVDARALAERVDIAGGNAVVVEVLISLRPRTSINISVPNAV